MTQRPTTRVRRDVTDGLLQPGLLEAIARCIERHKDFSSYLDAIPAHLRTRALTALRTVRDRADLLVTFQWPTIWLHVLSTVSPEVLASLHETLSLQPKIHITHTTRHLSQLDALVRAMGSAIDGLHITIDPVAILPHEGNALADLVLQCASLRSLIVIAHEAFGEQPVFDALLRATAHPAVQTLVLDLRSIEAPLHLGYHLRDWVRTAPATSLSLSNISRMPMNAAVAFCSALHANSTLAEIKLERVNGIDGFLGRRLPTSLRELYYDHERHEFIDDIDDTPTDAVLADLARALAPTRLEHLSYSYFGELALQPCLSSMLSVLTSLELVAAQLDDDRVPAFAAGLAQLGSLKTLVLVVPNYLYGEGFRSVLETLCVHCPSLETLDMADNRLDHDELMLLLEAVPRLPQLRKLEGWVHDWPFESVVPRFTTALVAASRQLRELNMTLITDGTTQQDLYDALATIENRPFTSRRGA